MTRFTLIALILILILGCTEHTKSTPTQTEANSKIDSIDSTPQTILDNVEIDTILERNNPKSLDLTKHQIFIDTTRSSEFYERLRNWEQSELDKQTIELYLNEINKDFQPKEIDLKGFPSHFITLRKLNNQFVLYDRCDGVDPRFKISDTAFISYGPLELGVESISKLISLTNNSIELELRTYQSKSNNQKSRLKIEKIEDFIYKMTYAYQTYNSIEYLTTINGIENFDLVVNNCTTMKMLEFDGFDKDEEQKKVIN